MKRRNFLVYSALLGLGLVFAPYKAAAANEGIIIPLPEAEEHVRHGSLNLHDNSGIELPNGVSNVKFQRFYKNGFVESPEDLCVVTFEYENETVIIQFKFSELCDKGYLNCTGNTSKGANKMFRLI